MLAALLSAGVASSAQAQEDAPVEAPPEGDSPAETAAEPEAEPAEEPPPPELADLDPNAPATPLVPPGGVPEVGGPAPGQTERPAPPPRRPRPPLPPTHYAIELMPRAAFPIESSFDRTLSELRYRSVRIVPTGYFGVQVPVVEWLWLGGRVGMRGMTWRHLTRDDATVVAGDLLVTAQVRFPLGRIVELGVLAAGGVGWMVVEMEGLGIDQLVPRFIGEGVIALRPDPHISIGPRFGWEYFVWEGMNAYDHALDIGGPFFGIAVEGRE